MNRWTQAAELPEPLRPLFEEASALSSLERVLDWMRTANGQLVDIVVQDEYTHDVVIAAHDVFWVFDST